MGRIYSPSTQLLRRGKGHFLFEEEDTTGLQHLGNIPDFTISLEITEDPHYSSMTREKYMDVNEVTEKAASAECTLEEGGADNLNLALLGDGVQTSTQSASFLDGVEVTPGAELFVQISATMMRDLTYTKLTHGAATDGPFTAGETVTGGTSTATAQVAWVGASHMEVVNVSGGPFTAGETLTGGTSTATATLSGSETVRGAVVVDDATTPTSRYVEGTDYRIIPEAGLIAAIDGGGISGAVDVSADYPAMTLSGIRALTDAQKQGRIVFVGVNSTGPRYYVEGWKVQLVGGSLSLISEDRGTIPLSMKFLADTTNHPNEPFFRSTVLN